MCSGNDAGSARLIASPGVRRCLPVDNSGLVPVHVAESAGEIFKDFVGVEFGWSGVRCDSSAGSRIR